MLVREDSTFEDLHNFLFDLFERFDEHLYRFECDDGLLAIRPEEKEPDDFDDEGIKDAVLSRDCYVGHHLSPGCGAHYIFDYGDYWEHSITVTKVMKKIPRLHYPKILKIKGEIPEQSPAEDDDDDF